MQPDFSCLYVEDDLMSRQVMQMTMEVMMGVQNLTILEDSEDFEHRLKNLSPKPDLVMLDIHVRPLDGFEMLNVVRKQPAFADTKVIALTASVMSEEIEQLRDSGFNGAIAKPFSAQEFPELIERVLAGESVWHIS